MIHTGVMRCKARHPWMRPWLRRMRCRRWFGHTGTHAGYCNKMERWTDEEVI